MGGQASWECQGRQDHGYFGDGTCMDGGEDDARYARVVHGVIGHLPAALRARWDGMLSRGLGRRTTEMLARLGAASGRPADVFAALLPDTLNEKAAGRLQAAGRAAAAARTVADEGAASAALAEAVQAVGLDNWSRVVADAEDRAAEPAPDVRKDAINPDYSVEELIGIIATGLSGGAVAAARAALATLARRIAPDLPPDDVATGLREGDGTSAPGQQRNALPADQSALGHVFRAKEGHLQDTPVNRQMLEDVANDPNAELGPDKFGNVWWSKTLADGRQVWARTRGSLITNGGINSVPKNYNPATGLSSPVRPAK